VNLVVNARDAMPAGGLLRVQTAEIDLGPELASRQPGAAPGPYVLLSVSDTGAGMEPAVLARAFEPFFTTKPAGQGTGLGLALVYGVVRQSGGFVKIASEPGHGTTVSVFLPRVEGPPDGLALPVEGGPPGGTERVLVVEDEPAVRAITCRILEERGYETIAAPNGRAALVLVEAGGPAPDLLLADVVMPEMGGPELARRLAARHPGLRVLFASGYPRGDLGPDAPDEGVSFLAKPFTPDLLARAVRAALDGAGARAAP
jgi:CheY-like chemotaxis protein